MTDDPINPTHYGLTLPNGCQHQVIDVISSALSPEEFRGFCRGNEIKYALRAGRKGPLITDLQKGQWYGNRLIDFLIDQAQREGITPAPVPLNGAEIDPIDHVMMKVRAELQRAMARHPRMRSLLEAASIVREEENELWEAIKQRQPDFAAVEAESLQLSAMGARLVLDLCEPKATSKPRTSEDIRRELNELAARHQELEAEYGRVVGAEREAA